jgi:hypothetical protein
MSERMDWNFFTNLKCHNFLGPYLDFCFSSSLPMRTWPPNLLLLFHCFKVFSTRYSLLIPSSSVSSDHCIMRKTINRFLSFFGWVSICLMNVCVSRSLQSCIFYFTLSHATSFRKPRNHHSGWMGTLHFSSLWLLLLLLLLLLLVMVVDSHRNLSFVYPLSFTICVLTSSLLVGLSRMHKNTESNIFSLSLVWFYVTASVRVGTYFIISLSGVQKETKSMIDFTFDRIFLFGMYFFTKKFVVSCLVSIEVFENKNLN